MTAHAPAVPACLPNINTHTCHTHMPHTHRTHPPRLRPAGWRPPPHRRHRHTCRENESGKARDVSPCGHTHARGARRGSGQEGGAVPVPLPMLLHSSCSHSSAPSGVTHMTSSRSRPGSSSSAPRADSAGSSERRRRPVRGKQQHVQQQTADSRRQRRRRGWRGCEVWQLPAVSRQRRRAAIRSPQALLRG